MDANRFATLTRSIAAVVPRRSAVTGLLGAGLTMCLVREGVEQSAAKKRCRRGNKRCKGTCIPKQDCCRDKECANKIAGQVCKNGRCACPGRQQGCAKQCIAQNACCTDDVPGCPYGDVCERGTCINCIGDPCLSNGACCTDACESRFTFQCICQPGASACTSDRQCCNGSCNLQTGKCRCDPNGSPCTARMSCCSGTCVDDTCVA
jgi:hypothetical protein